MRAPGSSPFASLSLLVAALLVGVTFGLIASCSPPPDLCWGGVVNENNVCTAKCDPAKCLAGNTCVGNVCTLKCTSHAQCDVAAQRCLPGHEDDTDAGIMTCQAYDAGGVGIPCPAGTECGAPQRCLSTGPGDINAYCTGDCTADAECPSGFECLYQRDARKVCDPDGGAFGKALCGTTTEACVDPALVTSTSQYATSSYCLQRKTCIKRAECATCTDDLDCSLSGQRCVDFAGGKICAPACAANTDCEADKQCTGGACVPRYGACAGQGGFCNPCRTDLDCGPGFSCDAMHGKEKSCVDRTFALSCTTSNDCPLAPSGRHGFCLDTSVVPDTSSVYHHCWVPYNTSTYVTSCYYPPTSNMPWPDAG